MNDGLSLLSFLDAPVLVGDPDGRVIYVNRALARRGRLQPALWLLVASFWGTGLVLISGGSDSSGRSLTSPAMASRISLAASSISRPTRNSTLMVETPS